MNVCPKEFVQYNLLAYNGTDFSVCYKEYGGVHISERHKVLRSMEIQSRFLFDLMRFHCICSSNQTCRYAALVPCIDWCLFLEGC